MVGKKEDEEFLSSLKNAVDDLDKELPKKHKEEKVIKKKSKPRKKKKPTKKKTKVKKIKPIIKIKKVNKTSDKKVVKGYSKNPTLKLKSETDIAMDFATKVYQRFDKIIKSIVLFGSTAKKTSRVGSDIDIIIIVDDASIKWDQE